MTEDSSDLKTTWALDIHKETIWGLYKTFELVGLGFSHRNRV
jgi:hypothetical protein